MDTKVRKRVNKSVLLLGRRPITWTQKLGRELTKVFSCLGGRPITMGLCPKARLIPLLKFDKSFVEFRLEQICSSSTKSSPIQLLRNGKDALKFWAKETYTPSCQLWNPEI
jgi:hypothetical protein